MSHQALSARRPASAQLAFGPPLPGARGYGIAASAPQRHDAVRHDWPSAPDEIPSPQLVAAWLILDTLPTELVLQWAAHWIAVGYNRQALAELAGLHGEDPPELRDLLGRALA